MRLYESNIILIKTCHFNKLWVKIVTIYTQNNLLCDL